MVLQFHSDPTHNREEVGEWQNGLGLCPGAPPAGSLQ
jgi:hypothetical protein